MTREQKTKELADAVMHGYMTIGEALDEAMNFGYKEASVKAWEFINGRTPESDRDEKLTLDYIHAMRWRKQKK